jgi:predicted nucleic acid-binding protein
MLYVDTSVIVKLYVKEDRSLEATDWVRNNNEAIPWTALHELEFNNAIHLKEFRDEITPEEAGWIRERFTEHEERGVYYRPQLNWIDTFGLAVGLSGKHTKKTGSRSLDILHVAAALVLEADKFLTFDERQSGLADLSGIVVSL